MGEFVFLELLNKIDQKDSFSAFPHHMETRAKAKRKE